MGELSYNDYYSQSNQRRRYNSGVTIENGKTVRYVKLVFDDDDFRRFADILVSAFVKALDERQDPRPWHPDPTLIPKEKHECVIEPVNALDEGDDNFAAKCVDIPESKTVVLEPETKPEQEEPKKKEWRSYLAAHDPDKITISNCLDCWASFYSVTNARIAEYLGVTEGAISHWRIGRHFPRKPHVYGLKKLMGLTDEEYDSIMANTHEAARKRRKNKKE